MRGKLWFSSFIVAAGAILVGVPALVIAAGRSAAAVAVISAALAVATALAAWLTAELARRTARPVQELAEAAGRLGAGDPRPLGRRYGVADLDQLADGDRPGGEPARRRPVLGDDRAGGNGDVDERIEA